MNNKDKTIQAFWDWYNSLKNYNGFKAKGTISGALVVLDRLQKEYITDINFHTAKGGAQIRGASGNAVKKILLRYNETRPFVSEGGRTNRGLRGDIEKLLSVLESLNLDALSKKSRNNILQLLQTFLVDKIQEFHNKQRLPLKYDSSISTWHLINNLLQLAKNHGKYGPVAQYLIGAKLQLRFPDINVGNESYSTADKQLGRAGDFQISDTVFHITVSPMSGVYDRCKENIENGLKAWILVPYDMLNAAKMNAESKEEGKICVACIESFISQNLEELGVFSRKETKSGLRRLLEIYNDRVNKTEVDKSMLVKIPPNL